MTAERWILSKLMSDANGLLQEFGIRYNRVERLSVYWLSIPILIAGTVGLLWSLPIPAEFGAISPVLNWGTALLLATLVYYFIISLPLAFGMIPFILAIGGFNVWLQLSPWSGLHASVGLIAAGLVGLYASHVPGGGLKAVAQDVQHMMIAPIWLLSRAYHKIGIPH